MEKRASAVLLNPLMKRVHADAPARHGTASRLTDERACLLRPAVHRPAFRTFTMLAYGFLAQTGKRTVCGMLAGRACPGCGRMTGRTRSSPGPGGTPMTWAWRWPAWSPGCWRPPGEPVVIAIDDTLFRRRGKRVWAAA